MSAHGRHQRRDGTGRLVLLLLLGAAAIGLLVLITHAVAQPRTVTRTVTHTVNHNITKTVTRTRTRVVPRPQRYARYVVQPGDTLWDIAAAQYWDALLKANQALLNRQHGVIYAGEVLEIPIVQS